MQLQENIDRPAQYVQPAHSPQPIDDPRFVGGEFEPVKDEFEPVRDQVRVFVAGWFDPTWRQRAANAIFRASYPHAAGLMHEWLQVREELDAIDRQLREQARGNGIAVFIGPGIVDQRVIRHLLEEAFIAHQVIDYPSCEVYLASHTVILPSVEQLLVYYDFERGHYRRKDLTAFLRGLNRGLHQALDRVNPS